jgi:elongation factor Ts
MLSPFLLWSKREKKKENSPKITKNSEPIKKIETIITNSPTMTTKIPITTERVKELRDQTGISVMQCKKALEEAGGDFEKALVILRKKSGELAAKKGDRTFHAGTVQAYIHANGTVGSIVELDCETDFVANNDDFKTLARDIAMHVTATNPKFLRREDIQEADRKTAREVFEEEVKGKPANMREKVLEGKLDAYFKEMVLLEQSFIKNPELTIQALIDGAVQKFGEKTAVSRFCRFKILEK